MARVTNNSALRNPNPGVLVAAHLIKLDDPMLLPHEHSFFALGTTVIGTDGPDVPPFSLQGHAFIHVCNCESSNPELTAPEPPPREDDATNVAFQYALLASMRCDDVPEPLPDIGLPKRPDPDDLARPSKTTDPNAPPLEATNDVSAADDTGRTMTVDEALDRLRGMVNEVDHPIYNTAVCVEAGRMDLSSMDVPPHTIDPRLLTKAPHLRNQDAAEVFVGEPSRKQSGPPYPSDLDSDPDDPYGIQTYSGAYYRARARQYRLKLEDASTQLKVDFPNLDHDKLCDESNRPLLPRTRASQEVVFKILGRIKGDLNELQPGLEELQQVYNMTICEALAEVGILQVTFDIAHEREAGLEPDPKYWLERASKGIAEKHERYAYILAQLVSKEKELDNAATHLGEPVKTEPTEPTIAIHPPEVPLDPVPSLEPIPIPAPPPASPIDWFPDVEVPPYVPSSPGPLPLDEEPYVPKSPKTDGEINEVRLRVSMLEDRVEATNQRGERDVGRSVLREVREHSGVPGLGHDGNLAEEFLSPRVFIRIAGR